MHHILSTLLRVVKVVFPAEIPQIILFVIAAAGFVGAHKQKKKMEEIAEGASTRFIGRFPRHLGNLIELANHAHREIVIMTDCVDYGSFFAPEAHREFVSAIENARSPARKVSVRILVCGLAADFTRASQFYGTKVADLRKDQDFVKCFNHFTAVYPGDLSLNTDEGFSRALTEAQASFERRLDRVGVGIGKLVAETSDLFLWIADDDRAVFLFPDVGVRMPGLAFQTRDSRLIGDNFKPMFERKWNKWLALRDGGTDGNKLGN